MAAPDKLLRATAAEKTVRALAAVTTAIADEARQRHRTAPTASAALGRTLTASLLLSNMLKNDEKLSLQFLGNGPLRGIFAEGHAMGTVRGFVYQPRTHLPLRNGKLDVGGAVGAGTLTVIRSQAWRGEPYRSILPIVSGEIGLDIAHYLLMSEQIPSAVSLGVFVDPNETVVAAGGFILQAMPGASPETISQLEANVARVKPVSQLIRDGATPAEILDHVLVGFQPTSVDTQPIHFSCPCSHERAVGALVAMGTDEVRDLVEKEGQAAITCEFCNDQYLLNRQELEALLTAE